MCELDSCDFVKFVLPVDIYSIHTHTHTADTRTLKKNRISPIVYVWKCPKLEHNWDTIGKSLGARERLPYPRKEVVRSHFRFFMCKASIDSSHVCQSIVSRSVKKIEKKNRTSFEGVHSSGTRRKRNLLRLLI